MQKIDGHLGRSYQKDQQSSFEISSNLSDALLVKNNSVQPRVKKPSSGTTIAVHLPADLRNRVNDGAAKCGLSKQDFYRLCLEIGMIFWDEAGSVAFTLHDAGKTPEAIAKIRAQCGEYGLFLPEEVIAR